MAATEARRLSFLHKIIKIITCVNVRIVFSAHLDHRGLVKHVCVSKRRENWFLGVPDKSSRGLGNVSRYAAHTLIYLITNISKTLCRWGGCFAIVEKVCCPLPLLLWLEWGSSKTQWNLPASLARRSSTKAVLRCSHWKNVMELAKLADKMNKPHNYVRICNPEAKCRECYGICECFCCISPVPSPMPAACVQQGHNRCFDTLKFDSCQTSLWKSFLGI